MYPLQAELDTRQIVIHATRAVLHVGWRCCCSAAMTRCIDGLSGTGTVDASRSAWEANAKWMGHSRYVVAWESSGVCE
jgi:hypothetical protein